MVAIRFDGEALGITSGFSLVDQRGIQTPTGTSALPCPDVGWPSGTCVALTPTAPLVPGHAYSLRVSETVLDRTGAPIGPFGAHFVVAAAGSFVAPALAPSVCGMDELTVGPVCALADDGAITVRARATGPVRAFLDSPFGTRSTVAPRGDVSLRLHALAPSTAFTARLYLVDLAGGLVTAELELETSPPLARLAIAEVRSDPLGPEPRQEYVEVLNSGPVTLDLEGFGLSDRADREGDRIEGSHPLPPGARALLVADGFDPTHADDDPDPPGVPLVRLGSSLASGGLSNAGEPLFLRDPEGRRVSAAPALTTGPGVCLLRLTADPRAASAEAFAVAPCTPGAAPSGAP
jgi:hypothetical protein